MMKILAADTSTMTGSVALLEGPEVVAEWTLRSRTTHNRRLLPTVDLLLQEVGWEIGQLDGFAVAAGPGSFTGIRIGLSTMKSFAWATGKAFLAIPTLDVLAAALGFASDPVCALLDARKQEVYYGLYQPDGKGRCQLQGSYRVAPPERLAEQIDRPTLFCGDGWAAYRDRLRSTLGDRVLEVPASFHLAQAGRLGSLAQKRFEAGETQDPLTAVPVYVRPSEAELKYPHLAQDNR